MEKIGNKLFESNQMSGEQRLYVKGKFLHLGDQKFYIKGVTYGTFCPDKDGIQFPVAEMVEEDFALMAENGINSVRTYTVPPLYVLDLATMYHLKVMVGLPWEQHITFLDDKNRKKQIIQSVAEGVQSCKNHPAILCFAIGNEIPASIVRWYGKKKIEQFLKQLYHAVKKVDPASLVTYVNYPTTEYLDLSFLDFDCFNVYLETPEKLSKYISRLHNLSGDRPLILAEIGLDSQRNGEQKQADTLVWQIETIFGKGCAGMFVFAWTDEWWRGGFEIGDWDFGLVGRQRHIKPALHAVSKAMAMVPFSNHLYQPFISVVVCSYNGSSTIRDTLSALMKLDYPKFEVIVINDGSKDNLVSIVNEYPVKLITTLNKGLSSARNTGMNNAKGEIVAYIDDDAYPEEHWLHYLAYAYTNSTHAAMGGPNIIPAEDGPIATCVANAPGGPVHVLSTDEIAEHIPGCNFSVRRDVLMKVGGFDPIYRAAGDDVDMCWRIQEAGYTIGFHPSAVVWHHRRNSLKAYWKQQQGYGKAEALLEAKWPEKYNGFGHLTWAGRIYGNGFTLPINVKKGKVFHGVWGSALFQSVYQPAEGFLNCLPLMPEWYLLSGLIGSLALLGFLWAPLLILWTVFFASVIVIIIQGIISAVTNTSLTKHQERSWKYMSLIVVLHIIQPVARLRGRMVHGLTPWRLRGAKASLRNLTFFKPKTLTHWNEQEWKSNEKWLEEIEENIIELKARVKRGGDFDKWDIKTRNGLFSTAKGVLTVEEHGANKQYVKFKYWANYSVGGLLLIGLLTTLTTFAVIDGSWIVASILCLFSFIVTIKYLIDSASVVNCIVSGFKELGKAIGIENQLRLVHANEVNGNSGSSSSLFKNVMEEEMQRVRTNF